MSSNQEIDLLVETATLNFKNPRGWFVMFREDLEFLTGLSDSDDILRALEERAKELGMKLRLELTEAFDANHVSIGWGQPRDPKHWDKPEPVPSSIARLQVSDCIKDLDER